MVEKTWGVAFPNSQMSPPCSQAANPLRAGGSLILKAGAEPHLPLLGLPSSLRVCSSAPPGRTRAAAPLASSDTGPGCRSCSGALAPWPLQTPCPGPRPLFSGGQCPSAVPLALRQGGRPLGTRPQTRIVTPRGHRLSSRGSLQPCGRHGPPGSDSRAVAALGAQGLA